MRGSWWYGQGKLHSDGCKLSIRKLKLIKSVKSENIISFNYPCCVVVDGSLVTQCISSLMGFPISVFSFRSVMSRAPQIVKSPFIFVFGCCCFFAFSYYIAVRISQHSKIIPYFHFKCIYLNFSIVFDTIFLPSLQSAVFSCDCRDRRCRHLGLLVWRYPPLPPGCARFHMPKWRQFDRNTRSR